MVRVRVSTAVTGVAGALLVAWLWSGWVSEGGLPLPGRRTPPPLPAPLPRIGLERIEAERASGAIGRRDVFAFGPVVWDAPTPAPRGTPVEAAPRPPVTPAPVQRAGVETGGPSLNVSFIGVVEGPNGLRVAVLEAEGRDVLTGREGDLVANRVEIVKIGLESLDVRDVGSDRVRRLPLEGGR
jgi:hypothetical protein